MTRVVAFNVIMDIPAGMTIDEARTFIQKTLHDSAVIQQWDLDTHDIVVRLPPITLPKGSNRKWSKR